MSEPDLPLDPDDAVALGRQIGSYANEFAAEHDRRSTFVSEGFDAIRELGYGALAVPKDLGGGGHTLDTICRAQAAMSEGCANTSLAIAMHQHNVLTLAWRWSEGDSDVEPILKQVADGLLLCSSGAMDLSKPGVNAVPVNGGLKVSGRKGLASGGPGCDVLGTPIAVTVGGDRYITSGFIPLDDDGVTILDSWDAMGMRGSGSNAVDFVDVFLPDENIIGARPWQRPPRGRGKKSIQSPVTVEADPVVVIGPSVVPVDDLPGPHRQPGLLIALAVIASVYLGIADGVYKRALADVPRSRHPDDPITYRLAGLMTHERRVAWWVLDGLLADITDESIGTEDHHIATMLAKRQVVLGSIAVVECAIQMLGSMSYMRSAPYEQALRDVRAGITHPLAPEATLMDVGRSVVSDATSQAAAH